MLVYCDTVILIYFLDNKGSDHVRAANRIAALRASGDLIAVSDLSRLESRVGPLRRGDAAILTAFDQFFAQTDVQIVGITKTVFDRATNIRATHNFKTPDAIHLAAAVEAGCGLFLTNDAQLLRFTDIPVELLP